ncbi:hypothetical protein [Virgibacillus necropolis]|uniref:Uncharacterized protein n=1 Tax=Virgibacillus necropolis TaxID=163877 RepID=A0A221MCM7_9BACI|nr:hypothetical protein [Virgibacillus necropolis]ASN05448.1 hypothetical protein CFK40_10720 [Virgibacillus necropolis]
MNRNLLKQLYWIIPGIIIIFGLTLLFSQNFSKVTEPPAPNWSRSLTISKTDVNRLPPIKQTKDGAYIITSFEGGKLATTTINSEFLVQDKKTYDIPVNKWTQVYQQGAHLIYFDFTNIYDKNRNKIVSDVERFYPLENTILYVKDKVLYQLSPDNKESTKVMNIDLNKKEIIPQEYENGINILTYATNTDEINITLQQLTNGTVKQKYQTSVPINPGKIVKDVSFALEDQKLGILLQEELEARQGTPKFFNYFMQTTITEQTPQPLQEIRLQDPAGNNDLTEISNVVLTYNDGNPSLLFQANGQTETQYNDNSAFNIYKATINEDGTTATERRSNTPAISVKPQWVNEETIAWLDLDSDGNAINFSSSDIAAISQATGFNQDDWIRTLGKTLGMLTASIFAVAISSVWFIWPIVFIALMYFFRSRTIDRDPVWVFYTGIGIYAIAALVWKNQFFVNNIYINAPNYLTFEGSSYFYMFVFAAISFAIVQIIKRANEWDVTIRIMYFVGIHILLLTTFFGPYVL